MCWLLFTGYSVVNLVSVAGCLGYDVLGDYSLYCLGKFEFQLLVV